MNTLLLAEDDNAFRHTVKNRLEEEFIVLEASLGRRAMEVLRHHPVDLILLNVRLPDMNGLVLLRDIRQQTDIPVILLSCETDPEQKIQGFELGADDYLHKPCDLQELRARIKAILNRYHRPPASNDDASSPIIHIGNWTLDRTKFQIFDQDNNPGNLTVWEFRLLEELVCKAGHACNRNELCEAIRTENYVPTPRAIDIKIARIRRKIGDSANQPRIIKTIRGIGYLLSQEAIQDEHHPPPAST